MKWLLILIIICLPMVIFIKFMSRENHRRKLSDPNVVKQKLKKYSHLMDIEFPPSTRLINFKEYYGIDDTVYLKIEIDKKKLQNFLTNSPFANEILAEPKDNPIPDIGFVGPSWWNTKSVKNWKSGQIRLPNLSYLNIFLDLDHTDKIIIYLEWFTT
ncbi:MAG: hypothetical protein KAJ52_03030 [Sedimentisphaerales bacterium]|nr:hypothetical protein [Sedimentisphaerales bacterium]